MQSNPNRGYHYKFPKKLGRGRVHPWFSSHRWRVHAKKGKTLRTHRTGR